MGNDGNGFSLQVAEKAGARNIDLYNLKMERRNKPKLPKIVILIDELADLMISAPDQTEHAVILVSPKSPRDWDPFDLGDTASQHRCCDWLD